MQKKKIEEGLGIFCDASKYKCAKKNVERSQKLIQRSSPWPRLQPSEQENKLLMVLDESPQGPVNTPEVTLT